MHLDRFEKEYEGGRYALEAIDLEARWLPPNWGFLPGTEPPYHYIIPNWSYFTLLAEGYDGVQDNAPLLEDFVYFKGDSLSQYHLVLIKEKDEEATASEITIETYQPDEFNEVVMDISDFGDPGDPYQLLKIITIPTDRDDAYKGKIIYSNDPDDYKAPPEDLQAISNQYEKITVRWKEPWLISDYGYLYKKPQFENERELKNFVYDKNRHEVNAELMNQFEGYNVYRSEQEGGPYEQIATALEKATFVDSLIESQKTYY